MGKRIVFNIVLYGLVLCLLQALLVPKYTGQSKDGNLSGEYYPHAGNNDVIFIGDCEVYENFSPITLWQDYGITSYIRGGPQQMIWQSYYLLEDTLRYETPEVVVFNVLSMKYDTPASTGSADRREAYNRMNLDTMKWSMSKWNAIKASMTDEERERGAMWTYLFPLLRYHDRWSQVRAEDITYFAQRQQVAHNGYLMQTGVKPVTGEHAEPPLVDYTFGENSYLYLDKMVKLCEEKGVELVLIKAPTLSPVWWPQWDEQMESYAKEHDLLYLNFLENQEEIGIDWQQDTYDEGLHLNVFGAEKLSRYFGGILKDQYALTDHRSDPELSKLWQERTDRYEEEKARLMAQ